MYWLMFAGLVVYVFIVILATPSPNIYFPVLLLLPVLASLAVGLMWVNRRADRYAISIRPPEKRYPVVCWRTVFGVFGLLSCAWLACMGFESNDTKDQWQQVQSLILSDWHPVAHTMLIWAATRIYNNYAFVVLCQCFCFSLVCGYFVSVMKNIGMPDKFVWGGVAFVACNPATLVLTQVLWKDTAFAIFCLLFALYLVQIHVSDGSWLDAASHQLLLLLSILGMSLMRHNGVLIPVPFLVLFPFAYGRMWRQWACVVLLFPLSLCLIKGPLYDHVLRVRKPDNKISQSYVETIGVPMSMMGAALAWHPEQVPVEAKQFLNRIASDADWSRDSKYGDFNTIKFAKRVELNSALETVPPLQFLKLFADVVKAVPRSSIKGFIGVTRVAWQPVGNTAWSIYLGGVGGFKTLRDDINYLVAVSSAPLLSWIFWSPGAYQLVLLVLMVSRFRVIGAKALLLVAPFVTYDLGTMLLLCGPDYRFFYFYGLVFVPIALALLSCKRVSEEAL